MKTAYSPKQWLNRLLSTPSGAPPRNDGIADAMTPMRDAMKLIKTGDLAGATAAIRDTLHRVRGSGDAGPATPPIEGSFQVLKEGTFSDYERPAPGPAGPAPGTGAQFQAASYTNAAGSRRYKLFIPSAYCGQPMPLLVMLHGCKQSPDDFALGTRMNELAEKERCFVLYPAQAKAANGSKCWNWFNAYDQRRGYGEPAVIAGLTRELVTKYGLDARRVYVAGLSAGGAMAVVMGRTYPDLYAAVGVHSGLPYAAAHDVPTAFAAMQGGARAGATGSDTALPIMPTIVLHGDKDQTVHPGNGERIIAQCAADAELMLDSNATDQLADVEVRNGRVPGGYAYTHKLYRDAQGDAIVEHWLVHGGGHAWFGGNPRGSYTDPKGPDASKEMMRFFSSHALGPQQRPRPS